MITITQQICQIVLKWLNTASN